MILFCFFKQDILSFTLALMKKNVLNTLLNTVQKNTFPEHIIHGILSMVIKETPNDTGFAARNPLEALELIEKLTPETPAVFCPS